jgi:hypothetical protein
MCESNGSVVSVFADGRKHISTEVVREGIRTVFTITFEAVESKPKELDIPEFMKNRGV